MPPLNTSEGAALFSLQTEKALQGPAHPEIFFDNRICKTACRASLIEECSTVRWRQHVTVSMLSPELSESERRLNAGRIQAGAPWGTFCQRASIRPREALRGGVDNGGCEVWSQVAECLDNRTSHAALVECFGEA